MVIGITGYLVFHILFGLAWSIFLLVVCFCTIVSSAVLVVSQPTHETLHHILSYYQPLSFRGTGTGWMSFPLLVLYLKVCSPLLPGNRRFLCSTPPSL
ncbi:hypothetical protein BJX64DRAFT_45877 [Aspergillus heterothallicus]